MPLDVEEQLAMSEVELLGKERELIKYLTQIGEREIKIRFLTQRVQEHETLIQSYKTLWEDHKEKDKLMEERQAKEINKLQAAVDKSDGIGDNHAQVRRFLFHFLFCVSPLCFHGIFALLF